MPPDGFMTVKTPAVTVIMMAVDTSSSTNVKPSSVAKRRVEPPSKALPKRV